MDGVVDRQLPHQAPAFRTVRGRRAADASPARNQRWTCRTLCSSANLPKTSAIASRTRRSGSFSIRSWLVLHVADGDRGEELAAARLLLERFVGALAEERSAPSRSSCPSNPRHTAQQQPFEVIVRYPHHPHAGERLTVVRRLLHADDAHFVVELPNGAQAAAAGVDDRDRRGGATHDGYAAALAVPA